MATRRGGSSGRRPKFPHLIAPARGGARHASRLPTRPLRQITTVTYREAAADEANYTVTVREIDVPRPIAR